MLKKEGQIRIPAGCAISGIMDKKGKRFSGEMIIDSISVMHERSNGLGGGFAAYGIYPDHKDSFAFHLFYDSKVAQRETEELLKKYYDIELVEAIPTRKVSAIKDSPIIMRYFAKPKIDELYQSGFNEDDFTVKFVFKVNNGIDGAFVVSSGKNMGVFKAVGYPEDIGEFYKLENIYGYIWTAHGRFPTNTPGWWGGAHPFNLLGYSVVHNGELSSYGSNREYLRQNGYECSLQTDTEVVAYLFDLYYRKHKLPIEIVCKILAPPMWDEINRMPREQKRLYKSLRAVYGLGLMNGPFSVIISTGTGLIALNDRIKLRPLVVAEKGDMIFIASEESAIRAVCENPQKVWHPRGGEPVIGLLGKTVSTYIEHNYIREVTA
ncbi:Glutamate synthase [NADPH] large chain [Koleobacter methoxysyntrophicus]|jgi:glutamate synthase domain-containing protein 1|uniref:Glutamate synthase [NADPH] large chain n=1 Tax=Koleobacter methoxysyntrophicus TaxID=2751313 RepID=A0A8A0RIZ7_9FIRM|nr:glutamine amidotransferase family protein [Koleobacter methoxysyntrophicus]QSQ08421.1 Glutamate synthase [NADPH] large chain [Koleobacter methoxysyntrophicus]